MKDGKVNVPEAGYKFISWERRDHLYKNYVLNLLVQDYSEDK